jgi:alkanesulfonate monooxygenase SsuD/methylene tetrahydromethanopterin reductase-like flavin-dependent oxidoreductase (luciferase family)
MNRAVLNSTSKSPGRELAAKLGPVGVWSMQLRGAGRPAVQDAAAELDELGLRTHQAVVLDTDADRARATAREGIGMFIGFPAYQNNLRRLGFGDSDLVPGGSDRLIDATVAWGSVDDIHRRLLEHFDAGADHVAIQVLGGEDLQLAEWRELATLLPSINQHSN